MALLARIAAASLLACGGCAAPAAPAEERHPWTEWGEWRSGLRIRAAVPDRISRGDVLRPRFAVEFDAAAAPPEARHLEVTDFDTKVWLLCTERGTGRVVEIRPYDCGMPSPPDPETGGRVPLDGTPPDYLWSLYFLSTVWDELRPGEYDALFELREPSRAPPPGMTEEEWRTPGCWWGIARTKPVLLTVLEAPSKPLSLRVPTRLSLRRASFPELYVEVYCRDEDLETVDVEVHNGFEVGLRIRSEHVSGNVVPPLFGDRYPLHGIPADRAGPFVANYDLEIYESAKHSAHLESPGPGSAGWRVLWRAELPLAVTAERLEEIRKSR